MPFIICRTCGIAFDCASFSTPQHLKKYGFYINDNNRTALIGQASVFMAILHDSGTKIPYVINAIAAFGLHAFL